MNIKGNVLFWSLVVSLGGFLFGFDTAVISGGEQAIQKLWNLDNLVLGQLVGMGLYGTVVGAFVGGIPADKYGRKPTLIIIAILFLICSIGSATAGGPGMLMFFRFIGGLGVGASSVVAPVYISEISPKEKRGQLTAMFQFNLVIGILAAYLSNFLIGNSSDQSWRIMLGVMAIPSILFLILLLVVPESPRWLMTVKNRVVDAKHILNIIDPKTVEESLAAMQVKSESSSWSSFISGKYNFSILLAFIMAFFNQLSGINAVIYYAPRILQEVGLGSSAALLSTVGIGVVNCIFTMLGLKLIDGYGRRVLMYIGSIGYIVSLAAVSLAFYLGKGSAFVPWLLFLFIASHAIGQGACIWVFISEIFPNKVRSLGMSLGSSTHWVFAAFIGAFFPYFNEKLGGATIFAIFTGCMILQLLWVWKIMPETKGVSLEDLEKKLSKS